MRLGSFMLRLQLANSRADICAPLCLIQNLHALPLLFVTAFYRWKEGSREWLGHNKTGMWIADSSSGGESLANLALGGEWERNFYYVQAIVLDWPESLFRFFLLLLFSPWVVSDSLRSHGLQHTRLPGPSLSLRVCSNSRPLSQWCLATVSSSVVPFSSCPQSFPA